MQGSLTQTKQGIVGRTTAITSDVLIEKEKSLSHAIGLGKITFLCAQENGLVMIMGRTEHIQILHQPRTQALRSDAPTSPTERRAWVRG